MRFASSKSVGTLDLVLQARAKCLEFTALSQRRMTPSTVQMQARPLNSRSAGGELPALAGHFCTAHKTHVAWQTVVSRLISVVLLLVGTISYLQIALPGTPAPFSRQSMRAPCAPSLQQGFRGTLRWRAGSPGRAPQAPDLLIALLQVPHDGGYLLLHLSRGLLLSGGLSFKV